MGFPGSSAGKESTCNAGDSGSIPGLGNHPREGIGYSLQYSWFSLVAQMESICLRCRRPGLIPGLGRSPRGGYGNPGQYSCLENRHGQRSLVGYRPQGHRVGHDCMTKHNTSVYQGLKSNTRHHHVKIYHMF